jgi:hypothetical protein
MEGLMTAGTKKRKGESEVDEARRFLRAFEALPPDDRELVHKSMKAVIDGTATIDEVMSQLRERIS